MTLLLDRPSKETPPLSTARTLFGSGDRGRSIQIGLVLAVIVWCALLFLFGIAAKHFGGDLTPATTFSQPPKPVFDIEMESVVPEDEQLTDEELKKLEPPPEHEEQKRLVPVNPDAPDNVPDNTRNLGARNQQVAQETPNLGRESDVPSVIDGDPEYGSQIKTGDHMSSPPIPTIVPDATEDQFFQQAQTAGNAKETVQGIKQAEAARDILAGNEKDIGESEDGIGSNIVKVPPKAPLADTKVEGAQDRSLSSVEAKLQGAERAIDPKQPRPRPRLDAGQVGTLIQNTSGTSNNGIIASDARWSQFGEYDQKMWETISFQWLAMQNQQRVFSISGSWVIVTFRLNDRGEVAEIIGTESTAGLQLERLCVAAITSRAPFGSWPDDMRAILGDNIVLKIKFNF